MNEGNKILGDFERSRVVVVIAIVASSNRDAVTVDLTLVENNLLVVAVSVVIEAVLRTSFCERQAPLS